MNKRYSAVALAMASVFAGQAYGAEQELGQMVVTATRQPVRINELLADVTVVEREEIERSGASNIIDLLALQPGIQFARSGGPGTAVSMYVRGAEPLQTKVLVDGMPFNTVSLSGSPLQYLPLSDIERIEIVRGPASAIYGADAMAGVIQVITRKGSPGLHPDAFAGIGSYNTRELSAGVSGGDEHWRFRIQGNSLHSDGFSAYRNASNFDADKDAYRNDGFGGSLSFLPTEGHEVGLSFSKQSGKVNYDDFDGKGTYDTHTDFENSIARIFSRNRLTSYWNSTLSYGIADEDRTDYSNAGSSSRRKTENTQWSWQNDIKLPLGTGLVAVERQEQKVSPAETFSQGNMTIESVALGWTASAGAHRWQVNGRHDDNNRYGDKNTGSIGYGYQLTQVWRANVSYGTAFKAPSLDQLYNISYGNPNLKPENARNKEASLIWDVGTQRASITYFNNHITDLIAWSGGYQNINSAKLEGVTFAYGLNTADWTASASLDLLNAKDEASGDRLGRRAQESLTLSILRRFGRFELGGEMVSAGPRYNTSTYQTPPMGGYSVFNLSGRYLFAPAWALEARINNLFDKQYELAQNYNTPGFNMFVGLRYAPK